MRLIRFTANAIETTEALVMIWAIAMIVILLPFIHAK